MYIYIHIYIYAYTHRFRQNNCVCFRKKQEALYYTVFDSFFFGFPAYSIIPWLIPIHPRHVRPVNNQLLDLSQTGDAWNRNMWWWDLMQPDFAWKTRCVLFSHRFPMIVCKPCWLKLRVQVHLHKTSLLPKEPQCWVTPRCGWWQNQNQKSKKNGMLLPTMVSGQNQPVLRTTPLNRRCGGIVHISLDIFWSTAEEDPVGGEEV